MTEHIKKRSKLEQTNVIEEEKKNDEDVTSSESEEEDQLVKNFSDLKK